jgi:AraC-like DNA-binding protein
MKKEPFAYHAVVHALEAKAGWSSKRRFASSVRHAIHGHLAYSRYHAAGRARLREGIGESEIERLVKDFLVTDINPAVSFIASLWNPATALGSFNAYNASANLGVRTSVSADQVGRRGEAPVAASRAMLVPVDDPAPCRTATLSVMGQMLDHVASGGRCLYRAPTLSHLAEFLGRGHSAAADVARALEEDWLAPLSELPARVGCQRRTLERRLREEELSAGALRQASRMMRATAGLFSGDSATQIAFDCGFSDAAHMSRAFQQSCGMPPSMLIQFARQDAATAAYARLPYARRPFSLP